MFVICKKCNKGIIVKIIGDKMLSFTKRQNDYNPVKMNIFGDDYQATIACTLCGDLTYIECSSGQIDKTNLNLREDKNGETNEEGDPEGSGTNNNTGGDSSGEPSGSGNPQSTGDPAETAGGDSGGTGGEAEPAATGANKGKPEAS